MTPIRSRRRAVPALLAALALLVAGAPAPSGSAAHPGAPLPDLISPAEELVVGRQVAAAVEEQFPLTDDPRLHRYLDLVGRRLAHASSRSDIAYFFEVVDRDELNAFALPGGHLYLNRGMIQAAESEAEVLSIVAHEIGHVAARHWAEQYTTEQLVGLGARIGLGAYPDQWAYMAANLFGQLGFLKMSRDDEREADRIAYRIMVDTGHDPAAMVDMFERLIEMHDREPNALQRLFSTHPPTRERIDDVQRWLAESPPPGDVQRDSERFRELQSHLEQRYGPWVLEDVAADGDDGEEDPEGSESPTDEPGDPGRRDDASDDDVLAGPDAREPAGRWVHLGREAWRAEDPGARPGYRDAVTMLREGDLDLEQPRETLQAVLRRAPFDAAAFDLWLALGPDEDAVDSVDSLLDDAAATTPAEKILKAAHRAELAVWRDDGGDALSILDGVAAARATSPTPSGAPTPGDDGPEGATSASGGTSPAATIPTTAAGGPAADLETARRHLRLARLHALFADEEDEAGVDHYFRLAGSGDPVVLERLFRDLVLVATADEVEALDELTTFDSSRADAVTDAAAVERWFRRFWADRDPLPADPGNPRIGEHYRRLWHARREFGLGGDGHGYFTDWESFRELSPQLEHYPTSLTFDDQAATGLWLDHRGIWWIRHGSPDGRIDRQTMARMGVDLPVTVDRNATWVFSAGTTRPMAVHMVERNEVDEWIQVLNLGLAVTGTGATPDRPEPLSGVHGETFRDIYRTRASLDRLFRAIATTRSRLQREDLLRQESRAMATFIKAAREGGTTDRFAGEEALPVTARLVDHRGADGAPRIGLELAVDLAPGEEDEPIIDADELQVAFLLYDDSGQELVREVEESYRLEDAGPVLVATLDSGPVEAGRYRYAVQVEAPPTGRAGRVRGRHMVDLLDDGRVQLSDLALRVQAPGRPRRTVPSPQRAVPENAVASAPWEVYAASRGDDGTGRLELTRYLLEIREDPGVGERILGIGRQVGRALFPLYGLAAEVGLFAFDWLTDEESDRLDVEHSTVDVTSAGPTSGSIEIDPAAEDLDQGIYELTLRVEDAGSGDITTRRMTFRVTEETEDDG